MKYGINESEKLLDDINEYLYSIERYLTQELRAQRDPTTKRLLEQASALKRRITRK